MSPTAYASRKEQRRERQARIFEAIEALPPEEQGAALFHAWPQRIPKRVWAELSSAQKRDWMILCLDRTEALMTHDVMFDYHMIGREALIRQRGPAQELAALIPTIKGPKTITLVFADPLGADEDDGPGVILSYAMDDNGVVTSPGNVIPLENGLAIALCEVGGLTIRQELTLKVQRRDEHGQMAWAAQERIYGVHLERGRWTAVSEQDMRENFYTNAQTGEKLPAVAGISFGDFERAARATELRKANKHGM